MKLDRIDENLLAVLRRDGRISNAKLAAEVGLSASACLRRLRLLENSGVIRGYTALIDAARTDPPIVCLTEILLERQTEEFSSRRRSAGARMSASAIS